MYKPMAGHNLMQAIARVNRVFKDKEGGLVVDYVGIAAALKQAMNDYTARDKKNYGDTDVSKVAYPKFLEKLSVCRDLINLFSDVKTEFSLFDPKFLEEIANMKEKNLAVELLKKLIAEQVSVYRRTNIVKSEKFSELIQGAMNRYLNGMLTNEEVIQELLKLAKEIADANAEGEKLGLNADELAFYDALTKPQAIKDFYEHDELIAITKELTDLLRKNRTIDWQKKESARAGMRRLVKRLLKKHKYPPEGMDDAVQTVMSQCEMWTDNVMTV